VWSIPPTTSVWPSGSAGGALGAAPWPEAGRNDTKAGGDGRGGAGAGEGANVGGDPRGFPGPPFGDRGPSWGSQGRPNNGRGRERLGRPGVGGVPTRGAPENRVSLDHRSCLAAQEADGLVATPTNPSPSLRRPTAAAPPGGRGQPRSDRTPWQLPRRHLPGYIRGKFSGTEPPDTFGVDNSDREKTLTISEAHMTPTPLCQISGGGLTNYQEGR